MTEEVIPPLAPRPGSLDCALCVLTVTDDSEIAAAVTVIEGYAVCDAHMPYMEMGKTFAEVVQALRTAQRK